MYIYINMTFIYMCTHTYTHTRTRTRTRTHTWLGMLELPEIEIVFASLLPQTDRQIEEGGRGAGTHT